MVKAALMGVMLGASFMGFATEKLDSTYCYEYGDETAPIKVTEYFSYSCPQCIELFKTDFPKIKLEYIDTGKVHWTFHPDPADKLTLQAMVYSEDLTADQKKLLFEGMLTHLTPPFANGEQLLEQAADFFGVPSLPIGDIEFLKSTAAFEAAFEFLKQDTDLKDVPTVEINGQLYDEMPSYEFLKTQIDKLLASNPSEAIDDLEFAEAS